MSLRPRPSLPACARPGVSAIVVSAKRHAWVGADSPAAALCLCRFSCLHCLTLNECVHVPCERMARAESK